jgi:hypothetical protein
MNANTETHELPTSDWEHSHAVEAGDELLDTQYDDGPFEVVEIHDDGSVTLRDTEYDDTETFDEAEITGALADGNFERARDGLSHELATF